MIRSARALGFTALGIAALAFAGGVAATVAVMRPEPPAREAAAPPTVAPPVREARAAAPAGPSPQEEEARRALAREVVAEAELDLANEISAGRAAAEGAPSEAAELGRQLAGRQVEEAEPAKEAAQVPEAAPLRPSRAAEARPVRRRVAEEVRRAPRRVSSAEAGGVMRWLDSPGPF